MRRLFWTFRIALIAGAGFAAAGGLALAAVAGLASLVALKPKALVSGLRRPSPALLLFAGAIAWSAISLTWSPYDRPDQALKLLLLTPLYLALPFAAAQLPETMRLRLGTAIVFSAAVGLLIVAFEGLAGAPLTLSYKIDVEAHIDRLDHLAALSQRMLARGFLFLALLAGPAVLLLWRAGPAVLRAGAAGLLLTALIAAATVENDANVVAIACAMALGGLALRWPARTLQIGLLATAAFTVIAPLLMGLALAALPQGLEAEIPLSWAWRVEIYRYSVSLIAENPIIGLGLDASREIDTTALLNGEEIQLLPLHAHNAALHIWVETGLVGALLFAASLVALARQIPQLVPGRDRAAMLAFIGGYWTISVMLGFGIWQEWHHGALSLAIAAAILATGRDGMARDLRPSP